MDNSWIKTIFTLTLIFLYFDKAESVNAKCGGEQVELSEKQINGINECLKVVGAASVHDLGIENGACFFKCTMEKKGLIDDSGIPHKERMGEIIDMAIADSVKAKIKTGLEKCFDDEKKAEKVEHAFFTERFLNLSVQNHDLKSQNLIINLVKGIKMKGDDGVCSTFLPLAMCVHGTFVENC